MSFSTREIVGISLWWCEGTKTRRDKRWKNARSYPIEITNTNPTLISTYMKFLRKDLKVSDNRIKVQLQIHEGDNQRALESYWAKITGVPLNHFQKTIVRPMGKKVGKSKGTCKVRFADKVLYKKMEEILENVLDQIH